MPKRNTIGILLERIVIEDSGCWSLARSGPLGYRQVAMSQRYILTHRLIYEHLRGQIPEGLELDHLCRNRTCCNPDHLEPVTHQENCRRGINRCREKTHCRRGHPFDSENTKITRQYKGARGVQRQCRTCSRENMRRYRREKSEQRM